MALTGMDIQEVRSLAAQMNNAAGDIGSLAQRLTSQLQGTSWIGPDREQFVSEWQGTHVAQLHQVVQALENASRLANQNAMQQEQASNS